MTPIKRLDIGVLMLPGFQWLDAVGPVDYINNHSQAFLKANKITGTFVSDAPDIHWHWVSSSLEPIKATSGPLQQPDCDFGTAPPLDYLLIPGADPNAPLPPGYGAYLHKVFADSKTELVLTVCTGSLCIAETGLLDGLHVASNKWALKELSTAGVLNKNVRWVGDRRWVKDGKVWSAAGITAGLDLAVEFVKTHLSQELFEFGREISEYEGRPDCPDPFAWILEGVVLRQNT